jgi:antitoxin (DNA-binding transcriptional repressor) of toxin-antitoxin stability system
MTSHARTEQNVIVQHGRSIARLIFFRPVDGTCGIAGCRERSNTHAREATFRTPSLN